jgi:hypothetical protein
VRQAALVHAPQQLIIDDRWEDRNKFGQLISNIGANRYALNPSSLNPDHHPPEKRTVQAGDASGDAASKADFEI